MDRLTIINKYLYKSYFIMRKIKSKKYNNNTKWNFNNYSKLKKKSKMNSKIKVSYTQTNLLSLKSTFDNNCPWRT